MFSQEVMVKYKFHINRLYDFATVAKNFTLQQNNDASIFEIDDIRDISQFKYKDLANIVKERDTFVAYMISDNAIEFLYQEKYYKDFKNNFQISNHLIGMKCQYVNDKIDLFDWNILNEKDTLIANYKCKKATTRFRGRDYIAYYANEIANQGGPWKFDGLPGFILRVKSKDGYLLIEPTEIKLNKNDKKVISNPFANRKTILFSEVVVKFLEDEKKKVAKVKSKPNPPDKITYSVPESIEDLGLKERVYE